MCSKRIKLFYSILFIFLIILQFVIILNMNIFELILSEPHSYQQTDFATQQKTWTLFKLNITTLFTIKNTQADQFIAKSKQLWLSVKRTSPQLFPIMIQYYMNQLEKIIQGKLCQNLKTIQSKTYANKGLQLHSILEQIKQICILHQKYIHIFDMENRYILMLRYQIFNVLARFGVKAQFTSLMKASFHKHCLSVLQSEVLEFQQNTKQYIQERYSSNAENNLNIPLIKQILEYLSDFFVLEEYFQQLYFYFNQQSQNFINTCTDPSERGQFLAKCLSYERSFQKQFIKIIKSQKTQNYFTFIINQLDDNVYYLWAKYCSKNILDIVVDYPQSYNTIISLKKCLDRSPLLNEIGEYLTREVEKRLLIPGVITQNILNQYINMLKVLQIIDPQGLIFEKITLPIKNYLLKRNDTLRCIISTLTDDVENYSKLTREVVKIPSKEYIEEMSSEQDQNAAKQWQILPVKQNKTKKRIKYQEIDLVTVLVGLYGSQQAFISEYQNMMAQKLMSAKDYNIDEEVRNIQLLKMRFGQSALQTCNIIVKDVKDSKRNDGVIHNTRSNFKTGELALKEFNCLAVSKGYWPINYQNSSSFQIPKDLQTIFNQYSKIFSQIKAMRKIFFHYNLGHVNLTLTFENGSFDFKCLPIQAIMINYFDEQKMRDLKNGISSQDLSNELKIPHNILKQKMSFWVHKGVIKQSRMTKNTMSIRRLYSFQDGEVVYYKPVNVYQNTIKDQIDDDLESSLLKESTSMESHLRHIIEGLILSILNTNGPKSPEKIHLLLKTVYKTDLDYTYGQAQTTQILKKMLQKKKIEFNGEVYSSKE